MNEIIETSETLPPVTESASALPLDLEPLEVPDDTATLWDRFFPNDVPFIKIGLLDHLVRRPYHAIKLQGPFKLKQLADDNLDRTYRSDSVIDQSGNQKIFRLLLRFDGDAFGYMEGDDTFKIYAPTPELAQAIAKQFRRYVKPQAADKPFFYIISIADHGPATEVVSVQRTAPATSEELALNYGQDFPAWERQWTDDLRRTPSGLTIFYGPPGCGKTSYLRALMARLLNTAVFYFIPVSASEMLFNPRFANFWVKEANRNGKKQKIVLLEDAEELLLPRDDCNRDKVSNLLNLADGFLGDHLKLQVIATTNAPVRELDKAILRPGRLIGQREFRRLTRTEAQCLAETKGLMLPDQADYSLAEIYNGTAVSPAFNGERQIGFH